MTHSIRCRQLKPIQEKLKNDKPVFISALGDSLTYGWEASFSYFDLFISKLRSAFCGVRITGHNAGVCGETAEDGLRRLPNLLASTPDVLIVQFAINDMYSGVPLTRYAAALSAIARKTVRSDTIPIFITSGPLLHKDERTRILPFYSKMETVAHSYDVPFADISSYWLSHNSNISEHYFDDGVHPNDNGYHVMANALYQIFKTL